MAELLFRLLEHSIDAGWTVLAILPLRLLLKKAPRWIAALMWSLVAIRLVLPVSLESPVSLLPPMQVIPVSTELFYGGGVVGAAPAPGTVTAQSWQQILPALWLLGVSVMLGSMGISWLRLRWKLREAVRLQDHVYQSERVAGPFVFGFLCPRIYLPYHISEQDMPHILAHENAHIRRRDHWWKPIGYVLLAVYWFHPLLWLAYILLCRDIELACDEKVIRQLDSSGRADYSQALLRCEISRRTVTACPLAFGEAGVKKRVKNVLNYKKPGFWLVLTVVVICAVAAVCLLTDPITPPETDTPVVQTPENAGTTTQPEATEPTHSNQWLNEHRFTTAGGEISHPQELIAAVEAELNCYAQQDLPEQTTRVFSYAIFRISNAMNTEGSAKAQTCRVVLQLMLKDYTLEDIGPGGLREGKEQVLPVLLTFGVEDGTYYQTGFDIIESEEALIAVLGEAHAKELLYGLEQEQLEKRLEKLRQVCKEKQVAVLLGEGETYADASANTAATVEYDMDGDGDKEQYYLGTCADGNLFTFLVGISVDGVPTYQAVFSSSPAAFCLEVGEKGVMLHSNPTDGSPSTTYLVTVQDGTLTLVS